MTLRGSMVSSVKIVLALFLIIQCVQGNNLMIMNCPVSPVRATRSALVYWVSPTVTSDETYTLTRDHLPGRYYYEDTTVTYTARDSTEIELCTFQITIEDNGSPVIQSCPTDKYATAPLGQTQVSVTWTEPGLASTVGVQISSTKSSGDQFDIGRTTVKYTFKNTANDSFCAFDIFVQEPAVSTVPTITCPDDVMITLPLGTESMAVTWDDPLYPTNLGSVTSVCGRTKGDLFFTGLNTITCVAYFENGAAKMCSFNVDVKDTADDENPSILNCPADITMYVAASATGAVVTWPTITITDNSMQDLNLVGTHTNGDFYNLGEYDVVYTGTDVAGNTVTCSFRVTVKVDNLAPTFITCPGPALVFYVKAGETSRSVSWEEPTAVDNSGSLTQVGPIGLANGAIVNAGITQAVMYTATDNFNNIQTCEFTVAVNVDQSPVYIGCSPTELPDFTINAEPGVNYANVTWPEPSVTDDLSPNSLILTKSLEPGRNLPISVHLVEYTATDESGNVEICSFVVTVIDAQEPVLGTCPNSQTYTLGLSQTSVDVQWTNPTATDNTGVAPVVTSSRNPGLFTAGTYTVTITATDVSGNIDTCNFTVTVGPYVPDSEIPVWSVCPTSTSLTTNTGLPTATYSWTVPTVTDNRGIVIQFESHTSPFAFPIGTNIVQYRATDEAGNEGICTFTVTVTDVEPPQWTSGCGRTIIHYVVSDRTAPLQVIVPDPVATDNSGVAPTITKTVSNSISSNLFPVGNTVVQYTATDGSMRSVSNCQTAVQVTGATSVWSPKGSVTLTHIRGVAGQFSTTSATQLLSELADDMDRLFRGSSAIGSQFAGINILSHTFDGGNPKVNFQLHFTRDGRHTSKQIEKAFYDELQGTNSLQFATNNIVVPGTFNLNVREFKLTTRLVGLDGINNNPPFLNNYDVTTSSVYKGLAGRFHSGIDDVYTAFFAFMISVVVDFRTGSVITDTILVFDGSSSTTEAAIVNQFNGKLNSVGELELATGLYFDRVPTTSNQELCPSTECVNGGTCTVDDTYTNVCTCPVGYTGTNCETTGSTLELTPLAIAAIIGGGVLLLILLFAALCCCMFMFQRPVKHVEQYPMERPFHILDDEASVASSMDIFMLPRPRERPYIPALPPPVAPVLHIDNESYPSDGPSFSPDGEVYVTGPNQVAIRPRSKRYNFY